MTEEEIQQLIRQQFYQQNTKPYNPLANVSAPQDTIENYEPSLAQRIGNGFGGLLTDLGIISNPYAARQIGSNLTTLGEFLPVVGDATAGDDFGTAVAKGDGWGMGLGALGAVPIVGDALSKGAKALRAVDDLPMDFTSRMSRAADQGFTVDAYHGTTHDFKSFNDNRFNTDSHFGGGHYLSSNVDDVNVNYAGRGPDLEQRIDQRTDELENQLAEMDIDELEDLADKYNLPFDPDETVTPEGLAEAIAIEDLQGHGGMVIPAKVDAGNTFDTIDDTKLTYEYETEDWRDYLDDAGGNEDEAKELAVDASWQNEPTGPLADFIESLQSQADEYSFDPTEIIGDLQEEAMNNGGFVSASDIDTIMRQTQWFAEDPDMGKMMNNEVYRQAIEDAGFDSIRHSGNIFRGMDIPPNTEHRIVFDGSRIRSKIGAKFDPKNKDALNMLGGAAGLSLFGTTLGGDEDPEMQ